MIKLSVALPVFNSKKIAWLAMEGLCRQKNIDFEWELVIAEEQDENKFGSKAFLSYKERLEKIGCKRIRYIKLYKWVPLGQKWKLIGQNCSDTSEAFVLQAADCYSEPNRLKTTYEKIVKEGYDWVQNKSGLFFDLSTKRHILYQDVEIVQKCGLNMATRVEYVRNLPDNERKAIVDGWLYSNIKPKKSLSIINTDDWKYGVDTHGLNNISKKRGKFFNDITFPFIDTNLSIRSYLPKDIVEKLYNIM